MKRNISKILSLLLAAVLILSLVAPAALAAESTGSIYLRTTEDLAELSRNCTLDSWSQGKTVYLEADIDLTGVDFSPIPTFGGTFEGQGHTISGLSITGSGNVRGLFRYIQPSGAVRDLHVSGSIAPSDRKNTLGGLVGENQGTITNCTFSGARFPGRSAGRTASAELRASTRPRDRSSTVLSPAQSPGSTMWAASPDRTTAPLSSVRTAAASTPQRWTRS